MIRVLMSVIIFALFISCNNSTEAEGDNLFSKITTITETDEEGNLIGEIDKNDWSPEYYENIYIGDQFWFFPKEEITFFTESNKTDSAEIRFANLKDKQIIFDLSVSYPYNCSENQVILNPGEVKSIFLFFTADSQVGTYNDVLNINSSFSDSFDVKIIGTVFSGNTIPMLPTPAYYVKPAYPNPITSIGYVPLAISKDNTIQLWIEDSDGNKIDSTGIQRIPAGSHILSWIPMDKNGEYFPNGFYKFYVQVGNNTVTGDVELAITQ